MKPLSQYIININEAQKDLDRIQGILDRAKGDASKEQVLAFNMAKSIKDTTKLLDRYNAAVEICGENHPITIEFSKKAVTMGLKVGEVKAEAPKAKVGGFFNTSGAGMTFEQEAIFAYQDYKRPKDMFKKGESYNMDFGNKQDPDKVVYFNNPLSMAFWDYMIGQISDGAWENSKQYDCWWMAYMKYTPKYDPMFKSDSKVMCPDPTRVAQYLLDGDEVSYNVFSKIYTLNKKELLPLIQKSFYMRNGEYNISMTNTKDKAAELLDKMRLRGVIDLDDFKLFLACPVTMNKPQIDKIIKQAFKDMKQSIKSISYNVADEAYGMKMNRRYR